MNNPQRLINRFLALSGIGKVQVAPDIGLLNSEIDTRHACSITMAELVARREQLNCTGRDLIGEETRTRALRFTFAYNEVTPQIMALWAAYFFGATTAPTGSAQNEKQIVAVIDPVTSFKLRMSLEGFTVTTKAIPGDATADDIKAALTASRMMFLQPGDVDVTGALGGGTLNEKQGIHIAPLVTGGTYKLDFDGEETANIAWDANAAAIQEALEGLPNVSSGDVEVTGTWPNFVVEFKGSLEGTDAVMLVPTSSLTPDPADVSGPGVTITTTTPGGTGVNEVQSIVIDDEVGGGTYTLTYSGQTTAAIAYNANAAAIQAALEALSNIDPGDVIVTGTYPEFSVEFDATLGEMNVAQMTADKSGLEAVPVRMTEDVVGGTAIDGVTVEFKGRMANANLPLMTVVDKVGGGSVTVTSDQNGSQLSRSFTRSTDDNKQRFSFALGWDDVTDRVEKYVGFVVESLTPTINKRNAVGLNVSVIGPWEPEIETDFDIPVCETITPLMSEDCRFEVNGSWETSDLNALSYTLNDNVPTDETSAYPFAGPDITVLQRGDRPTYDITAGVFGSEQDPLYLLALNERTQEPVDVKVHFGQPGDRFTLHSESTKIKFQSNRIAFAGSLNESVIQVQCTPYATTSAPVEAEAYISQAEAFLTNSGE